MAEVGRAVRAYRAAVDAELKHRQGVTEEALAATATIKKLNTQATVRAPPPLPPPPPDLAGATWRPCALPRLVDRAKRVFLFRP